MDQVSGSNIVKVGIDLSEFYLSVEWDILAVPASRNEEYHPCCTEPFTGTSVYIIHKNDLLFFVRAFLSILFFFFVLERRSNKQEVYLIMHRTIYLFRFIFVQIQFDFVAF